MSATASWQRLASLENNDIIHVLTFCPYLCNSFTFTPKPGLAPPEWLACFPTSKQTTGGCLTPEE
jgi:hypothetical protein